MPRKAQRGSGRAKKANAGNTKVGEKVKDYRHEEKRPNNPPAGLATYDKTPPSRRIYSYDPHLDPQLVWAGKAEHLSFDVENVALHIHERISTAAIIRAVQREEPQRELFADPQLPLTQQIEFYQHEMNWANRLILGDSLLVMNSLLERELMAGKVQMIYVDPPYGVRFSSNFQPRIDSRQVQERDDDLTREPETIKAYRDAWTLGVHSYLTYLRDRLLPCRELLHASGSIFVQISDKNLHRVRLLLDELFGPGNFVGVITVKKTGAMGEELLDSVADYLLWYAKDKSVVRYRQLYLPKELGVGAGERYTQVEMPDGAIRPLSDEEVERPQLLPKGAKIFLGSPLTSQTPSPSTLYEFEFGGRKYRPRVGGWKTQLRRDDAPYRCQQNPGYTRFC